MIRMYITQTECDSLLLFTQLHVYFNYWYNYSIQTLDICRSRFIDLVIWYAWLH